MRWIAVLGAALTGCFTAQGAAGPTYTSDGKAGAIVTAGVGLGYGRRGQAVFAVAGGALVDPGQAHGAILDQLEYARLTGPVPMRANLRIGPVFGRERLGLAQRTLLGGALTWFARVRTHGDGRAAPHSEKGGDLPLPRTATFSAIGVEVAVDAYVPAAMSDERTAALITVSLVAELVSMLE